MALPARFLYWVLIVKTGRCFLHRGSVSAIRMHIVVQIFLLKLKPKMFLTIVGNKGAEIFTG